MDNSDRLPRTAEEIANFLTHSVGLLLSVTGAAILLFLAAYQGTFVQIFSCSVYAASLLFVYATSTLYHFSVSPTVKHFFRVLDHIGIFLLIAGTYTPFSLVLMRDGWGWVLFSSVWACALIGIVLKIFSVRRFRNSFTLFYLFMGWMAVIFILPILESIPAAAMVYMVIGGLCYTVGVAFYLWEKLPFSHAIWHLFVMAGSLFHYLAILFYVLPSMQNGG